jgi:hypothetical protein
MQQLSDNLSKQLVVGQTGGNILRVTEVVYN